MNTSRLSRLTAGSHLLVCIYLAIAGLVAGCEGPEPKESVQLTEGVAIIIPTGWSQLDNGFANMVELVGVPQEKQADSMGTFPARLRVFVETRRSFDESVARLGEIAAEWEGPREYFLIDDWPALERRYDMPLPRRGQDAGKSQAIAPSITVAVAYDSTLVRIEGHLNPDSDRALLDTIARAGRSLQIERKGDSENSKKALERLRKKVSADRHTAERTGHAGGPPHLHFVRDFLRRELVTTYLFNDVPNTIDDPVLAVGGASEISVAVADDGQDVVVATNSGFSFSNDGGQTFNFGGGTPGPNNSVDGDPSVTWAQSDTFYYGYIAFPDGTAAWNNVQGCSTGISSSTDGGQTFNFVANATLCPFTGAGICFPDQEHIAADRVNAASGNDQVYSVWRDFTPAGAPANCGAISTGFPTASIVCSQDSGVNWTAKIAVDAGDFPRVSVGGDGFVYVTYSSGGNIMLNKFSSCSAGLNQQAGFPVTVAAFNNVGCPVPGLDRCNNGNILASPTVAVSDKNNSRVYVAFATNTAAGNENVVVRESRDGGATFPNVTTVNTGGNTPRFMPWLCAQNGRAYVSYYDRRSTTVANNDLTGFFLGEAIPTASSVSRGTEIDLTGGVTDAQCAPGWPCLSRSAQDSESCSVQPQLAGRCRLPAGGGSNALCDYSNGCAAPGEFCNTGGGCPKYGDYNYVACANGRIYTAWASATPPNRVAGPVPAGINTYVQVVDAGNSTRCLPWNCRSPVDFGEGKVVLECLVRGCRVFDPLPKNCLVKWKCPGCEPGGLCPPWYHMQFEGFTPDEWEISVVDANGEIIPFEHQFDGKRHLVSFRPDKRHYIDGQIGDYLLVFTLGPKGVPGKRYEIRTNVERSDKPIPQPK